MLRKMAQNENAECTPGQVGANTVRLQEIHDSLLSKNFLISRHMQQKEIKAETAKDAAMDDFNYLLAIPCITYRPFPILMRAAPFGRTFHFPFDGNMLPSHHRLHLEQSHLLEVMDEVLSCF